MVGGITIDRSLLYRHQPSIPLLLKSARPQQLLPAQLRLRQLEVPELQLPLLRAPQVLLLLDQLPVSLHPWQVHWPSLSEGWSLCSRRKPISSSMYQAMVSLLQLHPGNCLHWRGTGTANVRAVLLSTEDEQEGRMDTVSHFPEKTDSLHPYVLFRNTVLYAILSFSAVCNDLFLCHRHHCTVKYMRKDCRLLHRSGDHLRWSRDTGSCRLLCVLLCAVMTGPGDEKGKEGLYTVERKSRCNFEKKEKKERKQIYQAGSPSPRPNPSVYPNHEHPPCD